MAVCSFFLRGQCKFGDKCRNEHSKDVNQGFGSNWSSNNTNGSKNNTIQYSYTSDSMSKDFKPGVDKPIWSLSSYGPAKHEPNLVSGVDESFEELRVKATLALKNNTGQEYVKYEGEKIATADQFYNNAQSNIQQAYEQATQNTKMLEMQSSGSVLNQGGGSAFGLNTNTISTFGSGGTGSATGNSFGSKPNTSAFGQPSGFGALANTTSSTPAFSGGSSSAFGQPNTSGLHLQAQGGSAFGQSSLIRPATAFGTPTTSTGNAFGSNSGGGGFSAFAGQQPSAFGLAGANNTGGGSVFGQTATPATPGATSVFGAPAPAPSAFGSPAQATGNTGSVFGKPAQGSTTSVFGAPVAGSAFGSGSTPSAFQPSQGNPPSAFGVAPSASVFGTGGTGISASSTPSGFGAPAQQPSTSVFGAPATTTSAFGAPASGASAFGNTNNNSAGSIFSSSASSNPPFGQTQPSPFGTTSNNTSSFGSQPFTSAFGSNTSSGLPNTTSAPVITAPKKPKSGPPDFQNAPSKYKPGANKYDALLPDNYIDLLPGSAREAFEAKSFEWGKVPEWIPPLNLR